MKRSISLEQAKSRYLYRYTMEHKPSWANYSAPSGKYYAPQYASDAELYANTEFPGEKRHRELGVRPKSSCLSENETWPLGQWLDEPFIVRSAA